MQCVRRLHARRIVCILLVCARRANISNEIALSERTLKLILLTERNDAER